MLNRLAKQTIRRVAGMFGCEIRRIDKAGSNSAHAGPFQPYLEHFTIAGVQFSFWVGDANGKAWYHQSGHGKLAEETESARLLKPGDRVLEIGAHHGFTAMFISKLIGESGFILAVEPSPFNAMMASAQVGLNAAANCKVIQAAASDRKGNAKVSLLSNSSVTDSPEGIDVPTITVDELDAEYGPFNVLKIDVEGFERTVLAGAAKLLQRHPKIMLEVHSPYLSNFGTTMREVLGMLDSSYQGTYVRRDAPFTVVPYSAETHPADDITNLFLESTV